MSEEEQDMLSRAISVLFKVAVCASLLYFTAFMVVGTFQLLGF